jgi:hypothetical protein
MAEQMRVEEGTDRVFVDGLSEVEWQDIESALDELRIQGVAELRHAQYDRARRSGFYRFRSHDEARAAVEFIRGGVK